MENELVSYLDIKRAGEPAKDVESFKSTHRHRDRTIKPDSGDSLVYLNGEVIGSKENIVTITGRSKSRKTIVASALMSSALCGDFLLFNSEIPKSANVLHIDTEQGWHHYFYSVERILNDAGILDPIIPERFATFHTRDLDINAVLDLIDVMLSELKPMLFILDGVTDLVTDINDQSEAVAIGKRIQKWTTDYNLLFVGIIHTTKSTGFMTGAIGTYLEKKSETVIKVELDEDDNKVSHVSCQYSRNKPFETFSIRADEDNKYTIASDYQTTQKSKLPDDLSPDRFLDSDHQAMIHKIFILDSIVKKEKISKKLSDIFASEKKQKLTLTRAKEWVKHYQNKNWIGVTADNDFFKIESKTHESPNIFTYTQEAPF